MALEKQHILTKTEKAVMWIVFKEATKSDGVCLLRPLDFFEQLPLDLSINEQELNTTLKALEIDDYFELTESDKKGELVYCINLNKKGLAFERQERAFKKNVKLKIGITIGCACITATIGIIAAIIKSVI